MIWTGSGAEGAHRFVQRIWRLVAECRARIEATLRRKRAHRARALGVSKAVHKAVKAVGDDIEKLAFNRGVARL